MAPRKPTKRSDEVQSTALQIRDLLSRNRDQIEAAIPKHVSADRLMRVAVGAVARTPALQKCEAASLFQCIVQCATLGLEPSGPMGEAYLVPYGQTATLIIGYRGLINLARRSGKVTLFYADYRCKNDPFRIKRGAHPDIEHDIPVDVERGEITHFYAVVHFTDGSLDFEVMSLEEIEGIRTRSKAGNSGPWKTDYTEMAKKTAIRRLCKRLDLSVELHEAVEHDNRTAMGEINVTPQPSGPSPIETGGFLGMNAPQTPPPAPLDEDALGVPPDASDAWEPESSPAE
jgi:recombination protein RecT